MKNLNKNQMKKLKLNQNLLSWLVSNQSPSRTKQSQAFIEKLNFYLDLAGFKSEVDEYGNIYATKTLNPSDGLLYPCFVAHTDTAQKLHDSIQLVEANGILTGWDGKQQVGPGFDDKVGICIALQLAEELDNVKLFFPADEEVGCQGSSKARLDFFQDVSFCAQPDRRGNQDFIEYTNGVDVLSKEFMETVEPFLIERGYSFDEGTCTDIGELVNLGVGICCFNISCGYHNEHTNQEYLVIESAEKCLNFLLEFTQTFSRQRWLHNPTGINRYDSWDDFEPPSSHDQEIFNLTTELLYELEFVTLPRKVKSLINELNNLIYGWNGEDINSVSSESERWDSRSVYNRWDYLEM